MSVIAWGALTVAVVGTGYSIYTQEKAARNAGQVDTATAVFNDKYDQSLAEQLDLDTQQNLRTERADNEVYLSRQETSYAAAGVLSTSGSALHAMIVNAGRMEQQVQQEYTNSQQQQEAYRAKGRAGILAGDAQASADRSRGTLAAINGGIALANTFGSAYKSGMFSSGSKPAASDNLFA